MKKFVVLFFAVCISAGVYGQYDDWIKDYDKFNNIKTQGVVGLLKINGKDYEVNITIDYKKYTITYSGAGLKSRVWKIQDMGMTKNESIFFELDDYDKDGDDDYLFFSLTHGIIELSLKDEKGSNLLIKNKYNNGKWDFSDIKKKVGYETAGWGNFTIYKQILAREQQKTASQPPAASADYVTINGVKWATRNVGASKPEDYGKYYTGEQAKNACPSGWRLPTKAELEKLVNAGSVWTTQNGVNGRKFGNGSNTIFLPAAGSRMCGYYWSSTEYNSALGYNLGFNSGQRSVSYGSKMTEQSVRCVKE